mmetsp:Transcript_45215/g.75403  ORF Transcript_45215/g.75403 Transcript_45215/m.75403 type:complete len:411 (+) Transcript_45215:125-1357(+)
MNPNTLRIKASFLPHEDYENSNLRDEFKAMTMAGKKNLLKDGYTVKKIIYAKTRKRKLDDDEGKDVKINFEALCDRILGGVKTLFEQQKRHPDDVNQQFFERVTNSPVDSGIILPGDRYLLSLDKFIDNFGGSAMEINKTGFIRDVKDVLTRASNHVTEKVRFIVKEKNRSTGEFEMIPTKHMVLLSEPMCPDQLLHRDFSSEIAKHTMFGNKASVYIMMLALTRRCIRVCEGSHLHSDSNEEYEFDEECSDNVSKVIGLHKGCVAVMHPHLVHSGASNLTSSISVCLLTYVVMKDKVDKIKESFDVVDQRLSDVIKENGPLYVGHSSIVESTGLFARMELKKKHIISDQKLIECIQVATESKHANAKLRPAGNGTYDVILTTDVGQFHEIFMDPTSHDEQFLAKCININ